MLALSSHQAPTGTPASVRRKEIRSNRRWHNGPRQPKRIFQGSKDPKGRPGPTPLAAPSLLSLSPRRQGLGRAENRDLHPGNRASQTHRGHPGLSTLIHPPVWRTPSWLNPSCARRRGHLLHFSCFLLPGNGEMLQVPYLRFLCVQKNGP